MIKRSTWMMVILLVLVAGVAYYMQAVPDNFIQKALMAKNTPTPASPGTLISPVDGPLNGISLTSSDGHSVTLKRESTGWTFSLDAQSFIPADQNLAEQAASQALGLRLTSGEIKPATSDLSGFGLDKPAYIYGVTLANGKSVVFKLGKATVLGDGYFLQKEDGTIVAVDKSMMDTLLDLFKHPPYEVLLTSTPTPLVIELPTGTMTPPPAVTLTNTPAPGN